MNSYERQTGKPIFLSNLALNDFCLHLEFKTGDASLAD